MDQRAKGGPSLPPPSLPPLLPPAPPQQYPEEEIGGGTRREEGGGAVLEVLIEGRCGAAGQRQLPFPGRERSCTEGNVRLRIGVQTAKRTKKTPRTLEGYECKPTIRTYQRPGRGAAGRGSQEGGGSGQGNSPQEEGDGEQNQGSDPNTTQTRKIHSSSPPPSSSPSSSSTAPTTTTPSSANPQTAPAKQQVPVNLGHKKSDTLLEKPRHPDPPDAHSKLPSPAQMDQATPSDPTASSPHSPLVKDPSGEAGVKGEGGMLNGGVPTVTCHPTRLTKVKGRKQNCSSSAAPTNMNSTTRPPASWPHQADLAAQDRTSGFSCPPTLPPSTPLLPDQRGAPVADGRLSPAASLTSLSRGPLLQSYVGNERGKEEKAKKKKEKDDKARGEKGKGKRGEKGRGKEDRGRKESPKMDRDERGKEGTGMDESGRDMTGKEERNGDEDKEREKPRDLRMNKSPSSTKCKMLSEVQSRKTGTPSPDPDLTSGTGKSDDTGGPSRRTVSPSNPSTASSSPLTSLPPPSLSLHSSSPPTSPREQDNRPLKKRKTRRPSWTRLVNRAQRLAENPVGPQDAPLVSPQTPTTPQTSPTTPQTPATTNSPNLRSAESCLAPSVPLPPSPSSLSPSTSTLVRPRPAERPPSPTQSHLLTSDPSPSPGPDRPISQARKRGRPKSQTSSLDEPQPRHSPKPIRAKVLPHGHDETPDAHVLNPVLDHSPTLTNPSSPNPTPRKRGRPKRLPPSPLLPKQTLQGQNRSTLTPSVGEEGGKDFPSEKGNRQLRMRSIIGEMKRRKRRRLLREMLSGCGGGKEGRGGEGGRENSRGGAGGVCGSATAPSLSSSFGGNLGPQINVSKRGTIYMGKRRGRKPKAPANSNPASQSTLFTSLSGPSLFSSHQPQPHPPLSHPFPSPSLTHSSGAQSPYSDGGCTEPAPSLFLPHTFSLPSPSSSCASPRPLSSSFSSSSSLSPSLKRSSPGQGRHPLFHHPSSRLSSPPLPHPLYPHLPVFPAHLKEATPSPISKSHSKEMLPSDSVIGMDHNTISERGERRGRGRGGVTIGMTSDVTRSVFRTGLGVNLKGQRQPSPSMLLEHPSPVPSPLRVSASPSSPPSASPRHTPPSDLVEPRDRHRHRRRGYECPYTRPPCPCLGHNQRSHLDLCHCLAQNTHKRQKHKRKRKYQHLLMHAHDPDFLSELEDLIGQFSEVRIGRHRDWARAGLGQDLDESGGKRRHSSSLSSQNFRSNVYRINLSGYYSPHPLSYPPHPSFSPLHPHPCHGLPYGSRKPEQRLRCGCPTKPCESLDQGDCGQGRRCALQGFTGHLHPSSLSTPLSSSTTSSTTPMPLGFGYYRGYPLTMAHYPNPHPSYPLPPPHPYAPHLHPPHLLLNPARFHRRRSRQLREAGLGGGGGEDVEVRGEGKRAGVRSCPAGSIPGRSCVCGGSEHKLRHKHRHRPRDGDGKEEEEERVAGSQLRSEFTTGSGGSRKTGGQGSAGLIESPWQHRHGKYPSSFFSASAKPASSSSSSSSSSSERLKHTPLTCLGSSHLSSFGEGWGGRQNPWLRRGELGAGFRPPDPTWGTLTEGQRTAAVGGSEREAGERHTPCHSTFTPPTHTNLFTSSDTSGRGMRSGRDNWRPGSQDGSLRSEEPSQIERRGTGPHYDLSRRQLKWLRTGQSFGAKRGPGRPRKNPLASPLVSPFLSPTSQPNPPTETDVQNRDRNRGRGGGDSVQEVIEAVIQSQRRRRRKRRRIEKEEVEHPSCLQSSGEGAPVTHTPSICTGQTELTQTPSQTPASQSDKGADQLPRKRFQRAGLYSDDYKTTDPSSQNQLNRERLEYTPGEQDYSLLPAPIHVGKYLRMRRIDFQLPFDVMWLFRHNQLHKEPDVPLTREISSCQPKEKSLSSHQTGVSLPPSPQEECSSPSKKLFPYLDMETMTTSDRVFVLKHRVFLLRNWERVRDRQIRLRRGREGEREKDGGVSSYVATGDNNSHIMSGRQTAVKKVVWTSEPLSDPQCPHNPLNTTPHLTQNRQEEKKQVEEEEEEGWREVRKERLNNILLKLRQA